MNKLKTILLFAAFALCTLCIQIFTAKAEAAIIMVDDLSAAGSPTTCSLSDAVNAANANTPTNGCLAGEPEPTIDVIQLSEGTYENTVLPDIAESVSVIGTGSGTANYTANLSGITFSFMPNSLDGTGKHYSVRLVSNSAVQSRFSGITNGTLIIEQGDYSGISTTVEDTAVLQTTIYDSFVRAVSNDGISINHTSTATQSSTRIDSTEIDGSTSFMAGIGHDSLGLDTVTVNDTSIRGTQYGIVNHECPSSVTTLYIANSRIGDGGMEVGLHNVCGHAVITNTTFSGITGTAIAAKTNHSSNPSTVEKSQIDITNSTFYDITPSIAPLYFVTSSSPSAKAGVITVYTDPLSNPSSGSTLRLRHTTFAENTLGLEASVSFNNSAEFAELTIQNNAFEGKAVQGNYVAQAQPTVSGNIATLSSASGIRQVQTLGLGTPSDNGGLRPIGITGRLGNVLTLRPKYPSPLIDGASSIGVVSDQRGETRALLGAYDVGAVETTLAEYTADGGVWGTSITQLYNTGRAALGTSIAAGCIAAIAYFVRRYHSMKQYALLR